MKSFLFYLLFAFTLCAQVEDVDSYLGEALLDTAILDSKQIHIPGYPNAYNPSLIPYKDGYLLSFRYRGRFPATLRNSPRIDFSMIGVALLNKNLKINSQSVQLLQIKSFASTYSLTAEDARLYNVGDRTFIIFNDLSPMQGEGEFSMYLGELVEGRDGFILKEPAVLLNYPFAGKIEKNWSPFLLGDKFYLIYSNQPERVILEVNLETGRCQEVTRMAQNWNWKYGQIRGGTPVYPVEEGLFTFFHSSFPAKISKNRAYVMGACVMDKNYPFSVEKITSFPLGNLSDYTEQNRSKIVFPGGLVIEDDIMLVAWGKNDNQVHITTFDREKLLNSMDEL